jgi:hypothetical protein
VWNLPVLQASCYQGHVRAYFNDCSSKGEVHTLLAYDIWGSHSCDYEEYCVLGVMMYILVDTCWHLEDLLNAGKYLRGCIISHPLKQYYSLYVV